MRAEKIKTCLLFGAAALVLAAFFGGCVYLGWQWTAETLQASHAAGPTEVAAIARRITDYDLPPGYSERQGLSFLNVDMAVIGPAETASGLTIVFYQSPPFAGVSVEDMEQQLRRLAPTAFGPAEMETVGQTQVRLRGEETDLSIREGRTADGETWREIRGCFRGKAGPAAVFIVGSVAEWDQKFVDDFLASLR